ncbi:MAG: GUN4 domain-containing protein [Synechococcaceae cyanobacterium]
MLSGPPVSSTVSPEQLLERFQASPARQRQSLLRQLLQRQQELAPLIRERLDSLDATEDDWTGGCLLQLLVEADPLGQETVLSRFPEGWLAVASAAGVDYAPLQRHLLLQDYEAADRLTATVLRQLAGSGAVSRGYVYFSEVAAMPAVDLESLDRLWLAYSRGRFGFSVQGRLLAAVDGQWERLWPRLGWKQDGVWTRYPGSFTWSLTAPEGHMPLINQLRGVRLMDALLRHPALARRIAASARI